MSFHLIAKNDVHLWFLPNAAPDVDQLCAESLEYLAPGELYRYQSFRSSKRAKQFLLGRILMRRSLAAYLPEDSKELRFSYGPNGKPELYSASADDPVFSLSHCRDGSVMAIARAERIGVDIEQTIRAPTILRIARQFYSDAELRQLDSQGADAAEGAMALWLLKESVVKANGSTVWEGLSGVKLALQGKHVQWLSAPMDGPESNWFLMCGRYQAGCSLALAVKRPEPVSQSQEVHIHTLSMALPIDTNFKLSSSSGPVAVKNYIRVPSAESGQRPASGQRIEVEFGVGAAHARKAPAPKS